MNRKEEFEVMKKEYQNIKAPQDGKRKVEEAIMKAKTEKRKIIKRKVLRNTAIAAAAALALVILPNTNANIAYAMERIPVVGGLFKVITIRDYVYEDEKHQANVQIPQVTEIVTEESISSEAVETVNKSVEEYTSELVTAFEDTMEEDGYSALDISYETVTDTDTWFTLKINAVETQASGYEMQRFYHIDKTTGKIVNLQDLFKDQEYITVISEEILRQMKEQMAADEAIKYFIDPEEMYVEPFTKIKENQNFYFNKEGNLVIVFDEYEVGPGCIGCPEFVIPQEILEDFYK